MLVCSMDLLLANRVYFDFPLYKWKSRTLLWEGEVPKIRPWLHNAAFIFDENICFLLFSIILFI